MVAFSLFWFPIYWYGIFYFLAFLVGYLFLLYLKRYDFLKNYAPGFYNLLKTSPEDIILYTILWLLVWGRLWHIFIYDFAYYIEHPLRIFAIWEGGMSFIGGLLWVIAALLFIIRKYNFSSRDFWILADSLILPTSFGIMFWRIGNFLNQELYGRLVSDAFPSLSSGTISSFSRLNLFYIYDRVDWFLRINTNFLASFFEWFVVLLISFIVLLISFKKKKRTIGFLSSFFLIWYSFIRFFLEYLRMDSQSEYVAFLTKSQRFFVFFFIIGIFLMYRSLFYSRYMK